MIRAQKNKIFESIFSFYLKRLLRKHFHKIHIFGVQNRAILNHYYPAIIYVNHSNWWDGFIAFYLAKFTWKIDSYLMMDIEQMKKYRFFKWLGVFSVDRNSAQSAMESIDYACSLLKNFSRTLWLYPQGILLPNDTRPIKFYSGISSLADKLGTVNLLPLAIKYEFMAEQRPEIFLQIGVPDIFTGPVKDKKEFTSYLQNKLTNELDSLKSKISENNLKNFQTIFYGKDSRNKTVDNLYK